MWSGVRGNLCLPGMGPTENGEFSDPHPAQECVSSGVLKVRNWSVGFCLFRSL